MSQLYSTPLPRRRLSWIACIFLSCIHFISTYLVVTGTLLSAEDQFLSWDTESRGRENVSIKYLRCMKCQVVLCILLEKQRDLEQIKRVQNWSRKCLSSLVYVFVWSWTMSKNYLRWVVGENGCVPTRGNSIGKGLEEEGWNSIRKNQMRLACEIGRKEGGDQWGWG